MKKWGNVFILIFILLILFFGIRFFFFDKGFDSSNGLEYSSLEFGKIVWECFLSDNENCLYPLSDSDLKKKCDTSDSYCESMKSNAKQYLLLTDQIHSIEDYTFKLDSENERDSLILVYSPGNEKWPNEIYLKREEGTWKYSSSYFY